MLSRGEEVSGHRNERPSGVRGRLSPRQREVLDGILDGKPNRIIAQHLVLSTRTVEAHRAAIMSKFGVSNVAELVRATSAPSDATASLGKLGRIYPGLLSFWDTGLVAKFANDLHETVFGRRVDDIMGKLMNEVFDPSGYRQSIPFIHGVLTGKAQHFTQLLRTASGRESTFCSVYAPQFNGFGDVEGFFAFMMDSGMLSEDTRIGRDTADVAAWAEMMLDEEGRVVGVNEAFTDSTQFGLSEVRGGIPTMLRPSGVDASTFTRFWTGILAERDWQGTVWYRRRDGYLFRSRQRVVAGTGGNGQVGSRVMFTEIKIP